MRLALLLVLVVTAGCPSRADEALGVGDDDDKNGSAPEPGSSSSCTRDTDCATAAATCCECPTFAVNVDDPAHRACSGVMCPDPMTCEGNVRAACDAGRCVLACVPMACPAACPTGYAIDPATGCLGCACSATNTVGCTADTDCVQTRADCCGCDQGGEDTAVLAGQRASFDASLGCSGEQACPSVDVCDASAAPRCIQGRCELVGGDLPANACGRPDLPACPAGTTCTINASDQANQYGVGVCLPPS